MNILIPVDCNRRHEAIISAIEESNYWAYIDLDEGRIVNCDFFKNRKEANCWIDHIIVINETDYLIDFKQKNISVLSVDTQKSIDEIIESFLLDKLKPIKY
ncbi:hypothetical protein [Malaciobacter marinus]|uniref:Uncharacterized protein n=1 Tax=Malaciobacter marinus TaxID=505249 RepID=A0A347TGY2_9BACT|nr:MULTISPECIES: hypothetical protein [Malaciobacter]AXX85860.1 hypothetical protein AMRN_0059 [Malaciobacter marinus]PHO12831.1 hypothetical protein CPG38_06070 [Malaciobacter marinus]PHO15017.1 hypothetical protein CPH92_09185 [Malaciobacter marinus]RYA24341.1 hypothetical protein CRU96_03585 [Malaciobacter halophilus]